MASEYDLKITLDMPGFDVAEQRFLDVPDSAVTRVTKKTAWIAIHHYLLSVEKRLFETEGASGKHGKWIFYQPNELRYFRMKQKVLGPAEAAHVLQWGRMRRRLGPSLFRKDQSDHVWEVESNGWSAKFGTDVPYAILHQAGTNLLPPHFRRKGMSNYSPQRRVIDMTEKQKTHTSRIMWRHIWQSWSKQFRDAWRAARAAKYSKTVRV